jgi:hypothetical protein
MKRKTTLSIAHRAKPIDLRAVGLVSLLWLTFGATLTVLSPDVRAYHAQLGWLPFWLVLAPLINLIVIHRQRLAAASKALLVRARRRRRATGTQARKQPGRVRRPQLPGAVTATSR